MPGRLGWPSWLSVARWLDIQKDDGVDSTNRRRRRHLVDKPTADSGKPEAKSSDDPEKMELKAKGRRSCLDIGNSIQTEVVS